VSDQKPTHPYKGAMVLGDDGKRCLYCGLPRAAHPAEPAHPDTCEHGVRLKNHCQECASMASFTERSPETHAAIREERRRLVRIAEAHGPTIALQAIGYKIPAEPAPEWNGTCPHGGIPPGNFPDCCFPEPEDEPAQVEMHGYCGCDRSDAEAPGHAHCARCGLAIDPDVTHKCPPGFAAPESEEPPDFEGEAVTPAPERPFDKRAADALANEVAKLIERGVIDSRSPAADALLDYRDPLPPTVLPEPSPEPSDSFPPEAITAPGEGKVTITAAPEPLRRLAEEWMEYEFEHEHAVERLARLLERVVRECAEEACNGGHPKSEVLFHWGLSESEESKGRP